MISSTKSRITTLAAAAAIVALVSCDIDPEQAAPFTPPGNGQVTGQVFFDANGNGQFDPVGGDTAIRAGTVTLSARGDSATVLATTTTSSTGTFSFTGVPTGTHEVRARVAGGGIVICGPVAVNVLIGEQAFASAPLRVSCRIDVSQAERRDLNSVVTVGAIVTARPGLFRADNIYAQDSSGGLQIINFGVAGGRSLADVTEGDSIEVTGQLRRFNDERQIGAPGSTGNVPTLRIVSENNRVITPRTITARQLKDSAAARGDSVYLIRLVGELTRALGAKFKSFGTVGTTGTTGVLVQGTDTLQLRLENNANTADMRAKFTVDRCYDVTGILGSFNRVVQLKPRELTDVVEAACPAN